MGKAERFRRVRSLFDEATTLPAEQRAEFVRQRSDGDAGVEQEVLRLLASVESANQGGFLGQPAWQRPPEEGPIKTGTWFGPYRVVRQLSSGGMGAVYLVARSDDAYQRQAALKVIRPDCVTDGLVKRFHQEREILARLDHPNIARIVDGGTTSAGFPYFVMDYVDGQHLTDFCAQRRLAVEGRLSLFITVCRAVEYLHQNQIVHRDLKPSNILVTRAGAVKLVDFGIAKLLTSNPEASRTMPLLTPGYASPEHLLGETVGPSSDVYSLGVVLYELLTGRRPFQLQEAVSVQQLITSVSGSPPPPPSQVVTSTQNHVTPENPQQLRRRLSGDLDLILLLALRREPSRRYAHAGLFADDLERHLAGHPVSARPESIVYKSEKYLRRNWTGVMAAGTLLAVGGWGISESLERQRLSRRVRDLEQQAQAELTAAESRLLLDNSVQRQSGDLQKLAAAYRGPLVEALRLQPGMTPERDQLLTRSERYLGRVGEVFDRNSSMQLELAAGYLLLGKLRGDPGYPNLGDRASAVRLYSQARQSAAKAGDDAYSRELLRIIQQHETRAAVP